MKSKGRTCLAILVMSAMLSTPLAAQEQNGTPIPPQPTLSSDPSSRAPIPPATPGCTPEQAASVVDLFVQPLKQMPNPITDANLQGYRQWLIPHFITLCQETSKELVEWFNRGVKAAQDIERHHYEPIIAGLNAEVDSLRDDAAASVSFWSVGAPVIALGSALIGFLVAK